VGSTKAWVGAFCRAHQSTTRGSSSPTALQAIAVLLGGESSVHLSPTEEGKLKSTSHQSSCSALVLQLMAIADNLTNNSYHPVESLASLPSSIAPTGHSTTPSPLPSPIPCKPKPNTSHPLSSKSSTSCLFFQRQTVTAMFFNPSLVR
jgi:hypothetical protein